MDRLTNIIQDGPISALTLKRAESGNVTVWREWSQCQDPDIEAALHRLADYEDSGLTPERAQEIGKADTEGRVVVIHPNQRPSLSFGVRPSCWYTDKPNGYFCSGFCHGDIDDEPIDACKRCTWLDGNEDFREEAEAALAGMMEESNEQSCL